MNDYSYIIINKNRNIGLKTSSGGFGYGLVDTFVEIKNKENLLHLNKYPTLKEAEIKLEEIFDSFIKHKTLDDIIVNNYEFNIEPRNLTIMKLKLSIEELTEDEINNR